MLGHSFAGELRGTLARLTRLAATATAAATAPAPPAAITFAVAARSFAAGVGLRGIGCLGLFADFTFARGFSLGFALVLGLDIRLGSSVEHVFVRFDS